MIVYHTITVTSSDTSKGIVSGTTEFEYITSSSAQTVEITTTCTPESGYAFKNYTTDIGSISGTTLTIPAGTSSDISVKAEFGPDITITLVPSVASGHCSGEYARIKFDSEPSTGYWYDYRAGNGKAGTSYLYDRNDNKVDLPLTLLGYSKVYVMYGNMYYDTSTPTTSSPSVYGTSTPAELTLTDGMYLSLNSYTCSTCCFEPGTQVLVSLDGQTKNIEDIKVGDDIVAYNPEAKTSYITKALNLMSHENATDMAIVTTESGRVITMRQYHPILTSEGWKSITEYQGMPKLEIGDTILSIDGTDTIKNIELYTSESHTVYNVGNYDADNFYAEGIVVYNR